MVTENQSINCFRSEHFQEFIKWNALTTKMNLTIQWHTGLCQHLEWEAVEIKKQCEELVGGCNVIWKLYADNSLSIRFLHV